MCLLKTTFSIDKVGLNFVGSEMYVLICLMCPLCTIVAFPTSLKEMLARVMHTWNRICLSHCLHSIWHDQSVPSAGSRFLFLGRGECLALPASVFSAVKQSWLRFQAPFKPQADQPSQWVLLLLKALLRFLLWTGKKRSFHRRFTSEWPKMSREWVFGIFRCSF